MILFILFLYIGLGVPLGMLIEAIWRPLTRKWDTYLEESRDALAQSQAALARAQEFTAPEIPDYLVLDDDPPSWLSSD